MERFFGIDWFYSKLSGLCDGIDLADVKASDRTLSFGGLVFQSTAIAGSANVRVVVDLYPQNYSIASFLSILDSELRLVNAIQASLNDWLEGRRRQGPLYSIWKSCHDHTWADSPAAEEPSEASIPSYAVIVSAIVLLSLVYQYLTGNVDLGSSKAYSRSSLYFRDIYVAIVLFLGAYVWIKFRDTVACKGVHVKKRVNKHGRVTKVVYEPRFKPPRENGTKFKPIYLGQYATPQEASILYQIAAFYYSKGQGGSLDLGIDGRCQFSIPPMMSEGDRSRTGEEKRAWVKVQAMKVYQEFRKEKEEAALFEELLEACEDQATMPSQAVNPSEASLLNSAEHQLPLLAENSGLAIAMLEGQDLERASQSFGEMHEGFVTSIGHGLDFQEESAIPIPQLTPDTQSDRMGISNNSNVEWNLLQIVQNQQQQLQELGAQISVLQNQQRIQQLQLEESRIRIFELEDRHSLHQQLQAINQAHVVHM